MKTISELRSRPTVISPTSELQVYPIENKPAAQAFCREVFDDLLDKDLLGFLFSASHLHRYAGDFATYASASSVGIISRNYSNTPIFESFHKMMLRMFKGIHIEEASIGDYKDVLLSLDEKYQRFSVHLRGVKNTDTLAQTQFLYPQQSWRYRNSCLIKPLLKQD